MRRILIIGSTGQVGWELCRTLAPLGNIVAIDRQTSPLSIDLANPDSIRNVLKEVNPDLIVNAAAYTAVDKAEEEPELAMAVNGVAPGILAEEAKRLGAPLVHYSTDYVFDGNKGAPYTEDDRPNPINEYGSTKLAGDQAIIAVGGVHLILRTSWVYGIRGSNFLLTMLRLAKEREELRVIDDQIGSPTWSRMIAEITAQILVSGKDEQSEPQGLYNLTAAGSTSWCGFASMLIEEARRGLPEGALKVMSIKPIPTEAYHVHAKRPKYSCLSGERLIGYFGLTIPDWKVCTRLCVNDLMERVAVSP